MMRLWTLAKVTTTPSFAPEPTKTVDLSAESTKPIIKLASGSVIDSSSNSRRFVDATGWLQYYLTEIKSILNLFASKVRVARLYNLFDRTVMLKRAKYRFHWHACASDARLTVHNVVVHCDKGTAPQRSLKQSMNSLRVFRGTQAVNQQSLVVVGETTLPHVGRMVGRVSMVETTVPKTRGFIELQFHNGSATMLSASLKEAISCAMSNVSNCIGRTANNEIASLSSCLPINA